MRIFSDKMLLVSSSMLAQVMRVLATVVMARFIGPKENGAYYLIFIYTGFLMSLGDFAIPQSLVQIQGFSDRVLLDTAILLEGAIYALYGVVTVVAGLFITHHYADPRLWKVAIIIAVTNMLTSTYAVQLASLNRNLKFGAESRQNVVLSVSTAIAGIGFAVAGWGVYAIALQLLIGQVAANIVLQFKVPLKWPSHGSWTVAKRYMKLGIPLSGASYVWSVEGSIIGAIITSFGGEWAVGLWSKAVQVQQLFAQNIMSAFQRVAYPLLCRSIANPQNLKRHFGRLTVTLMLVSLLLTVLVAVNSRAIVAIVLGPDWVAAAPLLRITAWAIPAGALLTIGYMLCLALGIGASVFKSAAINLAIFIPILLVARRWELVGLAVCWSVTRYFLAGATLRAGTRRIAVGLGSVWRELARLVLCAAVSCASMFAVLRVTPPHLHLIFSLIISCVVGTLVYGALVLLIEREALTYAIRIARGDRTPEQSAGSDSQGLQLLAASMPEPADSTNSFLAANSLQPDIRLGSPSGSPSSDAMVNPNPNPKVPRVAMIQDGARLHYLVPLALQNAGILDRVFIDWFVREGSVEEKIAELGGKFRRQLGRKMAERRCPQLDPDRVIRNPLMALAMRLRMPRFARSEDSFIWASRQTAKWVIRKGFGEANVLYGFIRNAAPEAYRAAKARGLLAVGDQMIAPLEVEVAEMRRQIQRWPGWIARETAELHRDYLEFERQTWQTLDAITCASDYVREGLISQGIAPERISVIPYPWPQPGGHQFQRQRKSGPLVVGFVGAVGLRKGAGYFLETARRFDPAKMKFVLVGNVLLDKGKLEPYARRVQFVGPVPRSAVAEWLGKFDVFFFPSTCEGSAGAVMEAMGAGLAVLTTPNSGSRVRHGIDGFIRSCDDIDGFEQALRRLDDDRDLLLRMGESARARVLAYDLNAYQSELLRFFQGLRP